jgi:phosphoribosylglycinamide formyltransferase 1
MARILPIAVLVSGEGTTLEAIDEEITGGHLPAKIVVVVADRPHAPAIERARRRGLPTSVLPFRGSPPSEWAGRLDRVLRESGAELVILAGFLAILPADWVAEWAGRVINVHPSLLPRHGGRGLYGRKVHEAVLAAGERETGVTVHLVTDAVDAGPILYQERIPVEAGDSPEGLRDRIRPVERHALFLVIRRFADGQWSLPYHPSEERAPPGERRDAVS